MNIVNEMGHLACIIRARLAKFARKAGLVKRIRLLARDSRDLREKRDESEVSSSRVAPLAHLLLVSLTTHERRFTRNRRGSAITAEALMNNVG